MCGPATPAKRHSRFRIRLLPMEALRPQPPAIAELLSRSHSARATCIRTSKRLPSEPAPELHASWRALPAARFRSLPMLRWRPHLSCPAAQTELLTALPPHALPALLLPPHPPRG